MMGRSPSALLRVFCGDRSAEGVRKAETDLRQAVEACVATGLEPIPGDARKTRSRLIEAQGKDGSGTRYSFFYGGPTHLRIGTVLSLSIKASVDNSAIEDNEFLLKLIKNSKGRRRGIGKSCVLIGQNQIDQKVRNTEIGPRCAVFVSQVASRSGLVALAKEEGAAAFPLPELLALSERAIGTRQVVLHGRESAKFVDDCFRLIEAHMSRADFARCFGSHGLKWGAGSWWQRLVG